MLDVLLFCFINSVCCTSVILIHSLIKGELDWEEVKASPVFIIILTFILFLIASVGKVLIAVWSISV